MSRIWKLLRAEDGVALLTVMLSIFILTIVVAAMAIATMRESTLSFDQLRGQQALAVAESGAYRMLAELRRRLSVDLDAQIRLPAVSETDIRNICKSKDIAPPVQNLEMVDILANYAYPTTLASSDWTKNGGTAILQIGTDASPVQMTDGATGEVVGTFNATLYVQWSGLYNNSFCTNAGETVQQFVMYFDYAILSTGRAENAVRTVCLRSPGADRCADWLPSAPAGNWTGSGAGWPVLIEKAAYSQWALMVLNVGSVWMYTGTVINGPVHSNTRFKIAGNPVFNDVVTQNDLDMRFRNCGSQTDITIPTANWNTVLQTVCDDPTFNSSVASGVYIGLPPNQANPARAAIGLTPPAGVDPNDPQIRQATSDLPDAGGPVPDGAYIMDTCGAPSSACGGIYIRGNVQQMVLASESGMQVIYVTVATSGDPNKRDMKIVIDPITKAVTTYWGSGWSQSQTYPAGTFNGVLYIDGAITSDPNPAVSSGLYGILNRNMKLTIATNGEMRITDHLVYEAPPAGPGHNPANVLGLWSRTSDITMVGTLTPDNLYVDAAILSPTGRFWVEGWDSIPVKGSVYFLGGTVQGIFGAFGGFNPDTGYGRVMTYDWRLRSNVSPPFFPPTDIFTAIRWPSPNIVFQNGDPLYERPPWEEVVGL